MFFIPWLHSCISHSTATSKFRLCILLSGSPNIATSPAIPAQALVNPPFLYARFELLDRFLERILVMFCFAADAFTVLRGDIPSFDCGIIFQTRNPLDIFIGNGTADLSIGSLIYSYHHCSPQPEIVLQGDISTGHQTIVGPTAELPCELRTLS
jgi:hypothetical protein